MAEHNSQAAGLEEEITQHRFLRTFSKEQRRAMESKQPAPGVDAALYEKLRLQFIHFLMQKQGVEALLLTGDSKDGQFHRLLKTPQDYHRANGASFDGVAYTEAIQDCIRSYDPDYAGEGARPSFLGLFSKLYQRRLNRIRQEEINISRGTFYGTLPRETLQNLARVTQFLRREYPAYTPETLPEPLCDQLAAATGLSARRVRGLLRLAWLASTTPLDAPADREDPDGPTLGGSIPDFGPGLPEEFEQKMEAFWLIQFFAALTLSDYHRMFMSNLLLYPIHPKAGQPPERGNESYTGCLIDHQEELYRNVFQLGYLQFVEWRRKTESAAWREADPGKIEVLCFGYPMHELLDKTVAAYKGVTPAAVSYYKNTFKALLKQAAELLP